MQKPVWYWNRIKRMSPGEVMYRAHNLMLVHAQRLGLYTATEVSRPVITEPLPCWFHLNLNKNTELYMEKANQVAEGGISCFALEDAKLGRVPNWNRDPLTGKKAPLQFGKKMDYRDESLVGDIKYLWEPNRHIQLVTLAQAYVVSGKNPVYLDVIRSQLGSWFDQCPYLSGPNWASSLELGIRLINWSIVWQLIGGADSPLFDKDEGRNFRKRWLESIYQHAHFIRNSFSRFSSANNHLIGEAAGLYIATVTWPFWSQFVKWQREAEEILEEEAILQNTADGVNREQAVSYQQFVLDFLVMSGLAGRVNNSEFSEVYWKRIEAMLEYLASIMDVAGNMPMIGDADDGYVVRLSQEQDFCPYRSLLATGAILFNRCDFKKKAGKLDDKTRWLLGDNAEARFNAINTKTMCLPIHRQFPDGGYYILGADFETENEVRLIVDAGPLGYLSIAAHGHADALAFTLSIYGREFLVDPGTYAYHTQQKWRDYFRGTTAHNTVRIDEVNQSVISGNFMWAEKADAKCEIWESSDRADRFVGTHNGYSRLKDAVLHRREIQLDKMEHNILVSDKLDCKTTHSVERFLHFSERCQVTLNGSEVIAENDGVTLFMRIPDNGVEIGLFKAQENPPLGWISRKFDLKVPATTVVARSQTHGTASLITEFNWIRS